jgi:hypothetical protein
MNKLISAFELNGFIIFKHIDYPNEARNIYLIQVNKEELIISADWLKDVYTSLLKERD